MAEHMFTYITIVVNICMVNNAQVVDAQWAVIVPTAGLLIIINRQFHILVVIDHKCIHSIRVLLALGCIMHCRCNVGLIVFVLLPRHTNV